MEYRVRVRYDEPLLHRAVRAFMLRRAFRNWGLWALAVLMLMAGLGGIFDDGFGPVTALCLGGPVLLLSVMAMVWRAHIVNTVGRARAMDPPEAELTFGDAGMGVRSSLGEGVLYWSSITEVWEEPGFWMLFNAPNSFNTLPLETVTAEMLDFIRAKLPGRFRPRRVA